MSEDLPKRMDVICRDATQNLIFAKQQQISVTYYATAVYAGAVVILTQELDALLKALVPPLMTLGGLCFSLYFLKSLEAMENKYRQRLHWIYNVSGYFTEDERKGLVLPASAERPQWFTSAFMIVSAVGAAVSLLTWVDKLTRL